MHEYPQVGLLTAFRCVKGGAVFVRHMSGFCCEALGKLAISSHICCQVQKKWSKTGRKKWMEGQKKKREGLANAVVYTFCIQHHFLQLYWIRHAAVPQVSFNSVPFLRLCVTLHSQSPASRHFPSPLTKQVWLSMWTGCWGMMFGGTLILCGDLSGMTGNHNSRRCRRPVKSNECVHNVTMQHVMHALIRRTEGGGKLSHH